ncbi:sulfatase-like hydrolase/transferase [Sulfurovum sp. CS9]|uniref:sulfatase-like hydrolase/transferase n=1 Tax=Sulfurovum sp. CS9 TaxID=3391146 RepID=UPI0039EB942E
MKIIFNTLTTSTIALMMLSPFTAVYANALDNLPKPSKKVDSKVTKTYFDSQAGKVTIPTASKDAPNIVIFLIDDMGFSALSTFGGPIPSPSLEKIAKRGITYNDFHTTAQCSPTRAALLSGRNHHAVNMGTITEIGTGFDGYTSAVPNTAASIAAVLKNSGYSTSAWGKWHQTAVWEANPSGPFTTWPTGLGFDKFYGFNGGETHQFHPSLYDGTTPIEVPNREGYNLNDDLREKAIAWMRLQKTVAPDKPFFVYFAPGATHAPHHVSADWVKPFNGKFNQGWDKLRDETFAQQKKIGPYQKMLN